VCGGDPREIFGAQDLNHLFKSYLPLCNNLRHDLGRKIPERGSRNNLQVLWVSVNGRANSIWLKLPRTPYKFDSVAECKKNYGVF